MRLSNPTTRPPSDSGKPSRRRLTASDYRALGAFRDALRRFLAFSTAGALAEGLTSQQHQAMLAIKVHEGAEPISVGALAAALLIKNHSALGLVERLEERGLVTRRPSVQDRRRVLICLTPAAETILEVISRNNLGKLKSTLPAFTDLLHALEQLELPAPKELPPALLDPEE